MKSRNLLVNGVLVIVVLLASLVLFAPQISAADNEVLVEVVVAGEESITFTNLGSSDIDLSGYYVTELSNPGGASEAENILFTFPDNTVIAGGGVFLTCQNGAAQACAINFSQSLNNSAEIVRIYNPSADLMVLIDADTNLSGTFQIETETVDTDNDGEDDGVDNCPEIANPAQEDVDGDGLGDVCDDEDNRDQDSDGIENFVDNCPSKANPDQQDTDRDGVGDACDEVNNQEGQGEDDSVNDDENDGGNEEDNEVSSNSGGGGILASSKRSSSGVVLGETASSYNEVEENDELVVVSDMLAKLCRPAYINNGDYLYPGPESNSASALKLQLFFRLFENIPLALTANYDFSTQVAVTAFQAKYASEVLGPWNIDEPTGYVYLSTANKINQMVCSVNLPPLNNLAPDVDVTNHIVN